MAAKFPTAIEDNTNLPNPGSGSFQNSPSHSSLHDNANDAIKAIEAKVGTGSSTPTANTLMFGTGTGTSAWTAVTSSQLAATLSDETGTGAAVFANTPTLVTPKADTINEVTTDNGVTIDGVNLKDGALNTNNSVVTANITDNNITASKLATNAITLGYAQITSTATTTSGTAAAISGLSIGVTLPSGGRNVKITAYTGQVFNSSATTTVVSIWKGATSGTLTTQLQSATLNSTSDSTSTTIPMTVIVYIAAPAAGSIFYSVAMSVGAGTGSFAASATAPGFILAEAI